MSTQQRFDKAVNLIRNGPARDRSIEKKFTVCKFYKQSTKREMQSQDASPQVVAPLGHQPQPKQGATVKIEARCLVCVRGSAERLFLQWDHRTDVRQFTTVGPIYSKPEEHARPESDDTWRPDPDPSLPALGRERDAFAHEDVDDTETAALIGDGHAFGKRHGACHASEPFSSRSALEPSARSLRNDQTLNAKMSSSRLRGMRHSKCRSDQARATAG